MPRRALFRDEADDDDSTGSDDFSQRPPKAKRRRTTNGSDRGEPSFVSSNDSGFLSGALSTPVDESKQPPAESTPLIPNFEKVPSSSGVIKRIQLKNFMCHANLAVELGNNVNFITGRNGSGKSAIMAALVLGLGGKPATLNRGHTAKEYIRTGSPNAEISITFGNTGPEAYKPEKYGKEITIERVMLSSGSSQYKIKSARGGIVSTRCNEIQAVLRSYNFQLDNPIMILTQDTSRTFLNQANPKKLFELFYRGTQLQKMEEDFEVVIDNHESLATVAAHRNGIIHDLEKDVDGLNSRIESHVRAQENRERLAYLAYECGWAKSRDAQAALDEVEGRIERLRQKSEEAAADHEAARQKELDIEARLETATKELQEVQTEFDSKQGACAEIQQSIENAQRNERTKKTTYEKIEVEIARLNKDSDALRDHIRKTQEQQMNDDIRRRRDQKEAQLKEIEERRPELQATLNNNKNEIVQWENSARTHSEQKNNLGFESQGVTQRLNAARRRSEDLQMARSDTLARFGREAPALARLIDAAHARGQFHRLPRGPIGKFIAAKDDRWSVAMESCLGGMMLRAYMVHDFHDNRLLEDLMMRAGYDRRSKPAIFVRDFGNERTTYDVSRTETHSDKYPNVLSMLKFDDVLIRNLLIDQRRIETTILFENESEMRDVMRNRAPAKATSAYDIDGGNALLHPNFRFYPCQFHGGARFLVKSVDQEVQRLDEEIRQYTQEKTRVDREIAELQRQITTEEQHKRRCSSAIDECQRKIREDDARIRRLKEEINNLLPTNTDIGMFESELEDNERKLVERDAALVTARAQWQEAKAKLDEVKREISSKKQEERAASTQLEGRQNAVDQLRTTKNRKKQDTEKKRQATDQVRQEMEKATKAAEGKRKERDERLAEAKELHEEPIDTDREVKIIEREMRRLDESLRVFEQEETNLDDLTAERSVLVERLSALRGYLEEIQNTCTLMHKAIRLRKKGYRAIKILAKIEVTQKFATNLSGRQYSGKLQIDYQDKTLSIFVEPRQNASNATQRAQPSRRQAPQLRRQSQMMVDSDSNRTQDLRGLSGGERSFSTVSFILALWETMNCPSCCLDEFDVFMDSYARRVVMELLITFALKTRPNSQFIFLTPQSVSELPFNKPGLKVLQLEAPRDRRGPAAGGEVQN